MAKTDSHEPIISLANTNCHTMQPWMTSSVKMHICAPRRCACVYWLQILHNSGTAAAVPRVWSAHASIDFVRLCRDTGDDDEYDHTRTLRWARVNEHRHADIFFAIHDHPTDCSLSARPKYYSYCISASQIKQNVRATSPRAIWVPGIFPVNLRDEPFEGEGKILISCTTCKPIKQVQVFLEVTLTEATSNDRIDCCCQSQIQNVSNVDRMLPSSMGMCHRLHIFRHLLWRYRSATSDIFKSLRC